MLKITGVFIVIISAFLLGEYLGLKYEFRRNQLNEFGLGISFLKGDMEFSLSPLAVCAKKTGQRLKKPVGDIFEEFAARLDNGENVSKAWSMAIACGFDATFLKAEDVEAIYPLGKIFEGMESEKQERGIRLVKGYINDKVRELNIEMAKVRRLYRSFSVICGMFIAIILF